MILAVSALITYGPTVVGPHSQEQSLKAKISEVRTYLMLVRCAASHADRTSQARGVAFSSEGVCALPVREQLSGKLEHRAKEIEEVKLQANDELTKARGEWKQQVSTYCAASWSGWKCVFSTSSIRWM